MKIGIVGQGFGYGRLLRKLFGNCKTDSSDVVSLTEDFKKLSETLEAKEVRCLATHHANTPTELINRIRDSLLKAVDVDNRDFDIVGDAHDNQRDTNPFGG